MTNKKETKKGKFDFKKHKKEIIIIGVALLVAIVTIVFVKLSTQEEEYYPIDKIEVPDDEEDTEKPKDEPTVQPGTTSEETMIDVYGMSKEDAIKLVKTAFNSDNFEFTAVINKEAKYVVTAKNTITNTKYTYEVDPLTKEFYEI